MDDYRAGVVVFLFDEKGRILIGKRKGSHGAGTWSLPGGKLEFKERALSTISRELIEETGLALPPDRFTTREWLDNIWVDPDKGQQHWITLFTEAFLYERDEQVPIRMEPEKCDEWRWVDPDVLLFNFNNQFQLFHPLQQYVLRFPIRRAK